MIYLSLKKYLFLEREEGIKKEGEKHRYARDTSIGCLLHALPGNLAHNPAMCPDWESNWQPFGSQACTQSTEPHQLDITIILKLLFTTFLHFIF